MPLDVTITMNGEELETIRIARIEDFKGRDRAHEYIVNAGTDYATFLHYYNEGARVCVEKALIALHGRPR